MEIDLERRTRKPRPITVISLIDVMFVLLIFFMIAGHLEKSAPVAITLPQADSGQLLDQGPIEVLLSARGEVVLNDKLLTPAQVLKELKRQLKHNPNRIVTIKADAQLEANNLVTFMEYVRAAGGVNLSLVTESNAGGI